MPIDSSSIKELIETELAGLLDRRVLDHVRGMLVEPYVILRDWDYGEPRQQYPCWIVLNDRVSGAAIAYSECGFGPKCPWGIVGLGDSPDERSMGMDSGWFDSFLDVFFESVATIRLPIWRVFADHPGDGKAPLTEEGTWESAWQRVDELRTQDPVGSYYCDHAIPYGLQAHSH